MADVPRNINVTAKLVGGKVEFSMSGDGVSGTNGDQILFNKDHTKDMKKSDHYVVTFTLIDETNLELRYVKPKKESMWVKIVQDPDDPTCPAPQSDLSQFKADDVTDTVLTVRNKDDDKEFLKFALNFIPKNGNDNDPSQYVQYDPIGDNQNGGIVKNNAVVVVAVIVIVVVAAATTKLLGLW